MTDPKPETNVNGSTPLLMDLPAEAPVSSSFLVPNKLLSKVSVNIRAPDGSEISVKDLDVPLRIVILAIEAGFYKNRVPLGHSWYYGNTKGLRKALNH